MTTTSTRLSGTMNPPTPTTSFTLTENARIPAGTLRESRPVDLFSGTSFDSTTGSPRKSPAGRSAPRRPSGRRWHPWGSCLSARRRPPPGSG